MLLAAHLFNKLGGQQTRIKCVFCLFAEIFVGCASTQRFIVFVAANKRLAFFIRLSKRFKIKTAASISRRWSVASLVDNLFLPLAALVVSAHEEARDRNINGKEANCRQTFGRCKPRATLPASARPRLAYEDFQLFTTANIVAQPMLRTRLSSFELLKRLSAGCAACKIAVFFDSIKQQK